MRTLVDIAKPQMEALDALSQARGTSRAALIREAIDDWLARHRAADRAEALEGAFGLWADRGEDGVTYQERMRAEW